jgi:hypothetical protein
MKSCIAPWSRDHSGRKAIILLVVSPGLQLLDVALPPERINLEFRKR